jgi:hypothetical protein
MRGCNFALLPLFGMDDEMPDLNEFIPTQEAAGRFNNHVELVSRMMWEGSMEGIKIGRIWLVRCTALDG